MTSKAQETAAPVKGTEAKSSAGIIQLSVCDASGVQESIRVDSSISHNAFRTVLKDRFGDCVPMWRPFMASVVRKGKLVRDACFRADKVGDNNTLHGLGALSQQSIVCRPMLVGFVGQHGMQSGNCFSSVSAQELSKVTCCGSRLKQRLKPCPQSGLPIPRILFHWLRQTVQPVNASARLD